MTANSIDYQSERERAIRHLTAAGSDITAEAARFLLRLIDGHRRELKLVYQNSPHSGQLVRGERSAAETIKLRQAKPHI